MHVYSWNVNGVRSAMDKGLGAWLDQLGEDAVVALQETRASPEQIAAALGPRATGWSVHVHAAERPGYSGVALLARRPPDAVTFGLGRPEFDVEGRLVGARFGRLLLLGGYFPNGNGKERDHSRIPYKLAFAEAVRQAAAGARRKGLRVLVAGDFNTAHREIDLARPRENVGTSGFTPGERADHDRWFRARWHDVFRREHGDAPGHYTWWSQRQGVRARNIGWRIDVVLASASALPFLRRAFHQPEVFGSDHCPIGVELDPAILE